MTSGKSLFDGLESEPGKKRRLRLLGAVAVAIFLLYYSWLLWTNLCDVAGGSDSFPFEKEGFQKKVPGRWQKIETIHLFIALASRARSQGQELIRTAD